MNYKGYARTLLRITITAVGLTLAFRSFDFRELLDQFIQPDWRWLLFTFLLMNLSMPLRAYRWQLLLHGLGVRQLSLARLTALYFSGNFFNTFLPSGFGGDVVRVVEVAQEVPTNVAMGTVFLDRFTGLLVLFVMGLLAMPLQPAGFPTSWTYLITAVSLSGIIAGILLLDGRLIRRWGHWLPGPLRPVGDTAVANFLRAVQGCGHRAIMGAIAVSFLFALMLVAWWTAITHALHAPVSFSYHLLVVPLFAVALLVPTVGGIGVREALAAPLYAAAGLSPSTAVAIALMETLLLRLSGLIGAPIYLLTIWRKK